MESDITVPIKIKNMFDNVCQVFSNLMKIKLVKPLQSEIWQQYTKIQNNIYL